MAYLTLAEARALFQRQQDVQLVRKSAETVLNEAVRGFSPGNRYDIFLSHCIKDAAVIAGVKIWLEDQGMKVYVDWIDDKGLSRTTVTSENAAVLRVRMQASESLMFATSENSPNSKWMPWELGYFDGLRKGRIAILPLVANPGDHFDGQEYLGLYPKVENLPATTGNKRAFVTKGLGTDAYMSLNDFKAGSVQFKTRW